MDIAKVVRGKTMQYSRLFVALLATGTITACGGGGGSSTPAPTPQPTPDTQAPSITITGGNTVQHSAGTTFTAPASTVTDNVDSGLTATVTGTVGNAPGQYTLTYTASDTAGNQATAELIVTVVDDTAPTITLANTLISHIGGEPFTAPSATVTDNVDTSLTATVTGEVGDTAGDYTLTYTATDTAGNVATATLTVDVDAQISGTIVDARVEGAAITVSDSSAQCSPTTTASDGTFTVTCDENPGDDALVTATGGTDTLTGTVFGDDFVLTGPADDGVFVTPASTLGLDFIDTTFDPYDPDHPDYTENMVTHLLALTVIKDDIENVTITEDLIEDVLATAGPDAAQTVLASAGFPSESTQKVANIANAVGKTLAIAQATDTPLTQVEMYEDLLRAIQTDTDGTVLDAAITVIEEADLPEGVDPDFGVSSNEVMFSGVFGDAIRDENVYTFPSTAQSWAGYANENTALYPLNFSEAGTLTFIGSVPGGGTATLNFRFENLPYSDADPGRVEPSFMIEDVVISGSEEQVYQVIIPAQAAENTFSSLIMYIEERETPVMVQGVVIDAVTVVPDGCNAATGQGCEPGDGGGNAAPNRIFSGVFEGTTYDAETSTHTFPTGAADFAGFANTVADGYPLSFPNGGEIVFVGAVPAGGDANVRFRFEREPWPNVDPAFETQAVTISGSDEVIYSVTIPAQGDNTFSSVIMYINERDVPVVVKGVVINATAANGGDSSGGECNAATGAGCEPGDGGGTVSPPPTTSVNVYTDSPLAGWSLWDCCGGTTPAEVEVSERGNVAEFSIPGNGATVQGFTTRSAAGPIAAIDATNITNAQLSFDLNVTTAGANGVTGWLLKVESANGEQFAEVNLNTSLEAVDPTVGQWQTFTFPLSAFANTSLDLTNIQVIMVFPTWETGSGAVYQVDNVRITPAQEASVSQFRYAGYAVAGGPVSGANVTVYNDFEGGANSSQCAPATTDDRGYFELLCDAEVDEFLRIRIAGGTDEITQTAAPELSGNVAPFSFITPNSTLNLLDVDYSVEPFSTSSDNLTMDAALHVTSLFMLVHDIAVPAQGREVMTALLGGTSAAGVEEDGAGDIADGVLILGRFPAMAEAYREDFVALVLAAKTLVRQNSDLQNNTDLVALLNQVYSTDDVLGYINQNIDIDYSAGDLPPQQFTLNGTALSSTRVGFYLDVAPGQIDRVVSGDENGIPVLFTDPTGYVGDTHGTRVYATYATFDDAEVGVKVIKQSIPEYYYAFNGTSGSFGRPVKVSGLDAVIIDHLLDVGDDLTIVQKSWGNSPAWQARRQASYQLETDVNGDERYYQKDSVLFARMAVQSNALFVASLENAVAPSCDQRIPYGDRVYGGYGPLQTDTFDMFVNSWYIPDCGATNHAQAELGIGLDRTIFVSTVVHTSFTADGVFADNVVRVDMNAYDSDITNTTSHASPLVAAAAAKLAKHFNITDAAQLRTTLMTYVDAQTKIIDLATIEAL